MKFETLTTEERERIFHEKIDTTFIIDRKILGFENIENEIQIKSGETFFIPPVILDDKVYSGVILFSTQDNKGRWMRTMFRTYVEGGYVEYKKLNESDFEVKLKFTKH